MAGIVRGGHAGAEDVGVGRGQKPDDGRSPVERYSARDDGTAACALHGLPLSSSPGGLAG